MEKHGVVEQRILVGCSFCAHKFKADGRITYRGPWFKNTILDTGLDLINEKSMSDLMRWINVGTDNTTPSVVQTGLLSYLASTETVYGDPINTGQSTNPAHNSYTKTFEFAIGSCTGNLTEVGLSADVYNPNKDYFNRQLFRDDLGNPTTITVLSDEGLRVTAELVFYSDLQSGETVAGTFDLNGTSKGYVREMNTGAFADTGCGTYDACFIQRFSGGNLIAGVDTGTVLQTGGFTQNYDERTLNTYTAGDFYREAEFVWLAGTLVGDMTRIILGYDGYGAYEKAMSTFILDAPITIADTEQLTLTLRRSWGRYAA